jgi:hypothetical protein
MKWKLYRIIAGRRDGLCSAIGYLGNRQIASAVEPTIEEAVARIKAELDDRSDQLNRPRVDGVPDVAEFREALDSLEPAFSKELAALLAVHRRQPEGEAKLADLARAADLGLDAVLTEYTRLGKRMAAVLDFHAPVDGAVELPSAILTFALPAAGHDGAARTLRLRPQVLAAFGEQDREGRRRRVER